MNSLNTALSDGENRKCIIYRKYSETQKFYESEVEELVVCFCCLHLREWLAQYVLGTRWACRRPLVERMSCPMPGDLAQELLSHILWVIIACRQNCCLTICSHFGCVWQILNQKPIQTTTWRWDEQACLVAWTANTAMSQRADYSSQDRICIDWLCDYVIFEMLLLIGRDNRGRLSKQTALVNRAGVHHCWSATPGIEMWLPLKSWIDTFLTVVAV